LRRLPAYAGLPALVISHQPHLKERFMGEYAHAHHDGHHHNHSHVPSPEDAASMRPRLLVAFSLAVIIVLAQAVGSLVTGSLALLTDTAHAITDASGLLVALTAASLMTRPATSRHT